MISFFKNIAKIIFICLSISQINAQTVTTLINETFESSNGFTIVNGAQTNKWYRGTAAKYAGSYGLYVSNDAGVTNAYTNTTSIVHAYKDVTIPSGESNIMLYFNEKTNGESGFDDLKVYIGTAASTTVTAGSAPSGADVATLATIRHSSWYDNIIDIPASWANKTVRIIFSWRNDASVNGAPPTCIDNIRMYSTSSNGVWLGGYSNDFTDPENWSDNTAPSSSTDLYITSSATYSPDISGTDAYCRNLTIASGATLTVESDAIVGNTGALQISGNLVVDGSLNHIGSTYIYLIGSSKTISGSGDFFYGNVAPIYIGTSGGGAASYTINSSIKLSHLYVNGASTLIIADGNTVSTAYFFQVGTCTLNGTLEILGPAYSNSSGLAWAAPASPAANPYFTSGSLTLGASSTIKYCAGVYSSYNSKSYTYSGNTDYFYAAKNQTVQTLTYQNLSIATSNTKTVTFGSGSTITVSGNLTVDNPSTSGGILTSANTVTLNGNLILGNGGNGFTYNLGHRLSRSTGSGSGTFTMQDNDNIALNVTYAHATN